MGYLTFCKMMMFLSRLPFLSHFLSIVQSINQQEYRHDYDIFIMQIDGCVAQRSQIGFMMLSC